MANEWIYGDNSACYAATSDGFTLSQADVMTVGKFYAIKITVSGSTQGKISFPSLSGADPITENGDYVFVKKALSEDFIILPGTYGGGTFDGCVSAIEVSLVPSYLIKDSSDNTVFTMTDTTGVTADRNFAQYIIDWTEMQEGCYYIQFSDGTTTYNSDCFYVKLLHGCTLLLEWYNDQDGFGMDYSGLAFRPVMRVKGKLWKPNYITEEKQVYDFSDGTKKITYSRLYEEKELALEEIPAYMHRAFAAGLEHDNFFVDNVKNIHEDDETTPVWRNMSNLAPVIVKVKQVIQDLLNSNC